ncbi:MAG: hypothetical protein WB623_19200 [Candidatus Sulfotelmatobacter sp.]|jgi:hypothetical protein
METSTYESTVAKPDYNSDAYLDSIFSDWRTSVEKMRAVIASNPKLCQEGFDDGSWVYGDFAGHRLSLEERRRRLEDHRRRLEESRRRLEKNRDELLAASAWISRRTRRTKGMTWKWSSYGWKHVMQRETGVYVTNGAFIVAAIALGFKFTVEHNPGFNMSLIGKELARHREIPH